MANTTVCPVVIVYFFTSCSFSCAKVIAAVVPLVYRIPYFVMLVMNSTTSPLQPSNFDSTVQPM